MPNYTAPLDDMMFLFDKLRNNQNYNEIEKYKEVNTELVKDILSEAAKINQNIISGSISEIGIFFLDYVSQ